MVALIGKQDGLIYVNEVPEEPEFKGDYFLHYGPQKKYEAELSSAKDTAIKCADQEQAAKLLVRYHSNGNLLQNFSGGIYPIEGLQFEVKEEPEYPIDHTSYPPYKKVAILKLVEKEESQEELWDEAQLTVKDALGTYSSDIICDMARWAVEALKKRYTITRKP